MQAEEGIQRLKQYVDTLLVISNDKLRHQFGNLKMREAFAKADNVLATAAKCITDVINSTGQINVDFADVCTVMKNGGVAILGNASAAGENRAQVAIEEALNSPLLNDNEIHGAKWILININSAEGEHEFTMDEVDIIQNFLLSQAGENTDVILGLGYDNSLGNKIGITLIATGFEYNDPFTKAEAPKQVEKPKGEEKIVMTLGGELVREKPVQPAAPIDPLAPQLVDENKVLIEAPMPSLDVAAFDLPLSHPEIIPTAEAEKEVETHLQLKLKGDDISEAEKEKKELDAKKQLLNDKFEQLRQNILGQVANPGGAQNTYPTSAASGGYLARPSNIYSDPKTDVSAKKTVEEPVPAPRAKAEDNESFHMQLVIKNDIPAADVPKAVQAQIPTIPPVEDPALQDRADEERRKAAERLQKLRNLSFNINAADPNNELETVPAYIRRNMELYNSTAHVEDFYSNYSVKPGDNNQGQNITINTFLYGKKPE